MISKTKISEGNSTVLPSRIRKQLDLKPGDILEWELEDSVIRIVPRKRTRLEHIVGLIGKGGDALAAKKEAQKGGK